MLSKLAYLTNLDMSLAQLSPSLFFYSQIKHLGKVSYFWRYREELSQIWRFIAASTCYNGEKRLTDFKTV